MKARAPSTREFELIAGVEELADLRAFVRDAATDFGAGPQTTDDLVQAVDEAACNIIVHGYGGAAGEIETRAELRDGRIEIRLLDRGRVFDPTALPPPDLSTHPLARTPGGMGVHLMRLGTDAVHHRARPGGGNDLTLVRALDEQVTEDSAMPMTIDAEDVGGARQLAVLTLAGELDASNYERLIDAAQTAYERGARALVLDLAGLTFMASSGLVALYSAVRIMRGDAPPDTDSGWGALHEMANDEATAPNVRLAEVQPSVARVLERTGLRRLFELDDSRAASIAALEGS